MSNYFRVTGYHPQSNCSFIADSYGKFEKLWQFSSNLLSYGVKVIEVNRFEDSKDLNIGTIEENKDSFVLRAVAKGKPKIIEKEINGRKHQIVDVNGKCYIPNYKLTILNG